jgi:hypothetical protein
MHPDPFARFPPARLKYSSTPPRPHQQPHPRHVESGASRSFRSFMPPCYHSAVAHHPAGFRQVDRWQRATAQVQPRGPWGPWKVTGLRERGLVRPKINSLPKTSNPPQTEHVTPNIPPLAHVDLNRGMVCSLEHMALGCNITHLIGCHRSEPARLCLFSAPFLDPNMATRRPVPLR